MAVHGPEFGWACCGENVADAATTPRQSQQPWQGRRSSAGDGAAVTAAPEERRRRSSVGDVRLGELARQVRAQQGLRFSGSTTTQD